MGVAEIERVSAEKPEEALALIDEYYEAIGVRHRDSREGLLSYIADEASGVWVARYQGEAAGCILFRPLPELGQAGEVKRMYVRPAYRGLGIAVVLLRTLEDFAARRAVRWLYLDSKDDLRDAIAFYRRHGFEDCERYNENWQATVFMRKELARSDAS